MLGNFMNIFEKVKNIPIGILLEPIVKQLEVASDIEYNSIDFDFFIKIAKHPRLSLKIALQTMDALGKIYVNEFMFDKASAIPFIMIATRFIDGSVIQEYLFRFVKYSFSLVYKYETRRKGKDEDPVDFKEKNQRNVMVQMCERIVKLRNKPLNDRIFNEMCEVNSKIKGFLKGDSKALTVVAKLFGNPKEIFEESGKEILSHEEFVQILKKDQENGQETEELSENNSKKQVLNRKKNKVTKITSSSLTRSVNSLNDAKRGRASLEIEKIRQNVINREVEKRLNEERKKLKEENRKRALKKQFEKRKIEVTVFSKSMKNNKTEENASENSFVLREITDDETETLNFVLKRYLRVQKLLFKKYSSTGYKKTRVGKETFESAAEKKSTLAEGELYKLLKEQGVTTSLMSFEEFGMLIKAFCLKYKKPQIRINFSEFQEVLIQVSVFVYSRPPKDFSHLPPALSLKYLFEHFRLSSVEKGISTKFYDEPDPGIGDKEVVKKLNLLLEKDPNTPLPEGYKRVIEKEIEISYQIPHILNLSESQKVAVEVLDGLISKSMAFHILEPMITVKSVTRARGILFKTSVASGNLLGSTINSRFNSSENLNIDKKMVFSPSLPPAEVNLTPGIKFEIARLTGKYPKDHLFEVAKLVDDLLHTVDFKSFVLISRNNRTKIVNKVQALKEQSLNEQKSIMLKREKKRRFRKQLIKEELKIKKEEFEKKLKEEKEIKKNEEEKKAEEKKKKMEILLKKQNKRQKEIQDWKIKKLEIEEKSKKDEQEQKILKEKQRKRKRELFLTSEKQKNKKKLEVKTEIPEEDKFTEKSNEKFLKKTEQMKTSKKKLLEKTFSKEKLKKEENSKKKEEFNKIKEDPKILEIFKSMEKSLEVIFSHYCKILPGKEGTVQSSLSMQGYNKFCVIFNIVPGLTDTKTCLSVFRSTLQSKNKKTNDSNFLTFEDFQETLLR